MQELKDQLTPVLFVGHGDPMNAVRDNAFTRTLAVMGKTLEKELNGKPKAIMMISAHWLTRGTFVSVTEKPETIYDFSGFPEELYKVVYPAPGAPETAREAIRLAPEIKEDAEWGLDHGAWSVLRHIFPAADIPVFQLSIDYYKPMQYHFDLARKLQPLRGQGVLVIGSGNIVHNLRAYFENPSGSPFDWAVEFDAWVKEKIVARDFQSLINYQSEGAAAKLAVPTPDHYAPLIYALAFAEGNEKMEFTYEEVQSSVSMRSFRVG